MKNASVSKMDCDDEKLHNDCCLAQGCTAGEATPVGPTNAGDNMCIFECDCKDDETKEEAVGECIYNGMINDSGSGANGERMDAENQ